jgi:hypothetical protein
MLVSVVEGLVVLGETRQAAALYPLVRHCMDRTGAVHVYPNDARLLERIAGMAAAAGAQWDVAEAHFATALYQAERLPHRPEQAHTRRFFAGWDERGRPTQVSRTVRGTKKDAQRVAAE